MEAEPVDGQEAPQEVPPGEEQYAAEPEAEGTAEAPLDTACEQENEVSESRGDSAGSKPRVTGGRSGDGDTIRTSDSAAQETAARTSSAPCGDAGVRGRSGEMGPPPANAVPRQPSLPSKPASSDTGGREAEEKQGRSAAASYWANAHRERIYPVFDHSPMLASAAGGAAVLSSSLRTHPKGFRLLKQTSPLERRMNTYFRLPAQPPRRVQEEFERVQRQIRRDVTAPQQQQSAAASKPAVDVLLDGFMMLEAAGVQDPLDAKEVVINDARVCGVVTEDMGYFTNLTFLDLGENDCVHLGDLLGLEALTEVHLHCCNIDNFRLPSDDELKSLRMQGLYSSASVFPNLTTLNVSFNRIRHSDLLQLGQLNALERLDLSSNNLKKLPADMSFLPNVTMLALENNNFSSPDVILSLATMPSLVEVNLNRNQLSTIPRLSVEDGAGVCFPSIEVIGLGSNNLTYFEDVYSLTQISSLRRIVLWGNPIQHRAKDAEILRFEFGSLDVEILFELPIPPKRKIADFYAANAANFVAVSAKDLKPLPVVKLNRNFASGTTGPPPAAARSGPDGPSFFVTQPGDFPGGAGGSGDQPVGNGASAEYHHHAQQQQQPQQQQQQASSTMHVEDPSDPSWFSGEQPEPEVARGRPQRPGAGSTGLGSDLLGMTSATPASEDLKHADDDARLDDNLDLYDGGIDFRSAGPGGKKSGKGALRARPGGSASDDVCRPNQTMRAAMTELRRMLRQPLPPLHVSQYDQTTQSLSQRIVRNR